MFGLFQINFKQLLVIILVLALPIIAINLEKRRDGELRWYDRPFAFFISPAQETFTNFASGVINTTSLYINLIDVKKENRTLKEALEKSKLEMARLEDVKIENQRLKKILDFQQQSKDQFLAAQVVGVDLYSPDYATLKINKGTEQGIRRGQGVITYDGVVGYVLNTQNQFATVLVITDRSAVVDAMVQRSRARGVAQGLGKDLAKLKYLQRTDDVQKGDIVITGGLDGVFPKGMNLGSIVSVSAPKFGVTQKVEFRPTVDVSRIEEVLVILSGAKPNEASP